jgi:hypothetical protein
VAGTNLFNGVGANYGATFGDPGLFLRFDVVFDEQWSCRAGSIAGQTFLDLNTNNIHNDNESGLAGLTINLLSKEGKKLKTTYSDEAGHYSFNNLKPGHYMLQIELPKTYQFSSEDSRQAREVELAQNQHLTTVDIGLLQNQD